MADRVEDTAAKYEKRLRDTLGIELNSDDWEYVRDLFAEALDDSRRAALTEVLKIARGTKEDGLALAKKAEGDEKMAHYWRGEGEGAAEVERDIMNLLGIDWANGETEPSARSTGA